MSKIGRVACIGSGVIGAGWAARLRYNGIDVAIADPDPDAPRKVEVVLANAGRAMARLTMAPPPSPGNLEFATSIPEAVESADLVIEAVPERLDIKRSVYEEIEAAARADTVIASSTSGFKPTELQADMRNPQRLLVAHPFNPVYLLPLVELVGGERTDPRVLERTSAFLSAIGMKPLIVRKEIDAFIADRLLEAVWRESLWLVKDGIATTQEIDDAIRFGFGLRWAQMGLFETYRTAGGEAGMRHFLAQFGPCLAWPWSKLTNVPDYDDELVELIAGQSDAQSGHLSIQELLQIRDDNLVAIMQALKANYWGAGETLADYERRLFDLGAKVDTAADPRQPLVTVERRVPADWTDYNNHMNEARYLQCFADATDAFLRMVGVDQDYIADKGAYFTVETHIRHLGEAKALEPVRVFTQAISGSGKKLHIFHRLENEAGETLATGEHLLVHVDQSTHASSEPEPDVAEKIAGYVEAHAGLPSPDGIGRAVGQSRV